ncbi:cobaltochelatase subunit CobN [Pontibaca methylaminivorans]|uniref:Cobaltochelatase CobN subunit n=1 Tax=Pontibaca methylaminivorans TaxID=515897 RepID=A0A1R3X4W2_9RHOB|nr:cobaltochelatase subunit CobN [Pontibaca methylaminivorans]SIT84457.1 cobaltochelatase CobN subunit [Pontibaca methylaminivorans]
MRAIVHALALLALLAVPVSAQQDRAPVLRVLASDFVLPGKFRALAPLAEAEGVVLESVTVGPDAGDLLTGADLILLDVPRGNDRAQVEAALEGRGGVPRLTVGGGPPDWQELAPQDAARLAGWYAAGGAENYRQFFRYLAAWSRDAPREGFPDPVPLPETGIYHPDAPQIFDNVSDYLDWTGGQGSVVGVAISPGAVTGLQSGVEDTLIRAIEAEGLIPVAFWAPQDAVAALAREAGLAALVVRTHMRGGPDLAEAVLEMDIPVIQTLGYRDGSIADFRQAQSGVGQGAAAIFLAGAEVWGASDPLVLMAVENGEEVVIPEQLDALTAKLRGIAALQRKPDAEKRLALLFWNYPAGERNLSASNLNAPRSIAAITEGLAGAGYGVDTITEDQAIRGAQALLSAIWRSTPPEELLAEGLAATLPVGDYRDWLETLPPERQRELRASGDPARHPAVREVDGVPSFVIPRLQLGNLAILPQMPRDAHGHGHYHDTAAAPDHLYLAAYLWLREGFGTDAIIHLGTHGTQEWLKGKDRGLWAADYPMLAVGDVPVFYPYLQDNVAEAIQARRRGRAVIVSHQTPPFAPAGLQEDLRDIHHLIHDHAQLAEGPVRDEAARRIRQAVAESGLDADMGWDEARIEADFDRYLAELHDHLHFLAQSAVPLGLHTFGKAPDPDHRLVTVMQQLGPDFLDGFADDDEPAIEDPDRIMDSAPVATLRRWLREGQPDGSDTAERAAELDAALAAPGEMESLLAGLSGRLVPPGAGGDPIRNPDVRAGRNLYAFEADRIPAESAYAAGGEALAQVIDSYRETHGRMPEKLAFSLWASEAISHLGVTEAQVLHALGLRPVRDRGGRVTALEIIPAEELGRPRIDVVISATSVYRDQFDSFMRLLAEAIDRLAELDEPGNAVAANSRRIAEGLAAQGIAPDQAARLSRYRIFSNEPQSYGSGVSHVTLDSTSWDDEAVPAQTFLNGTRYAYGAAGWGEAPEGVNLFAEQLRGSDAAIMSRSSNLHGVLGTDHPFELLGGLALAIRHLDGASPELFISDLRRGAPRTATLASFLSDELRLRYLSPQWIEAMQDEGYAGTLAVLEGVNNLFGWQVTAPESVRADQWQAMFDTYVADSRDMGIEDWFETHNPSAQAQLIARMAEAIRKDYWDAPENTRRLMAERWQELAAMPEVRAGEAGATREFLAAMAAGYGLDAAPAPAEAEAAGAEPAAADPAPPDPAPTPQAQPEQVQGRVLEQVQPAPPPDSRLPWGLALMIALIGLGAAIQIGTNRREPTTEKMHDLA